MLVTSIDILYCERLGWRFEVMRWLDIQQSANDFLPLSTYEWIHDWPFVLSPPSSPSFSPSLHPLHEWHLPWSPAEGRETREKDTSRDKGEKDFEVGMAAYIISYWQCAISTNLLSLPSSRSRHGASVSLVDISGHRFVAKANIIRMVERVKAPVARSPDVVWVEYLRRPVH